MTTKRYSSQDPELDALYEDFAQQKTQPLWEMKGLLTQHPLPKTVPFIWHMDDLSKLGNRAMDLVPISRGGDRRVIALSNPGLGGAPYATNSLWAAAQFLGPGELAPAHRHSPAALRFIMTGEGVWTLVDGDPVHMGRGDLVLTPSMRFHEHHNASDHPMVWLDVLDLPIVEFLDGIFFEEGNSERVDGRTDAVSRSELIFGQVGRVSVDDADTELPNHSPLVKYRWADTEEALARALADESRAEARIRFTDPLRNTDVMPTMRCEMRRVRADRSTRPERQVGSQVCAVLNGSGRASVGEASFELTEGDIYVVPSWATQKIEAGRSDLDIFVTSDAPVLEALHLYRKETH